MNLRLEVQKKNVQNFFCHQRKLESLLDRILTRFSGLRGKEVSLKYADNNDWIELLPDDLDSFIDMIETASASLQKKTSR